jgi:hypothetical protein
MSNIGIRDIAQIGIADIDVYHTNNQKNKDIIPKNAIKLKLRIGVFFDGTGNNGYNSDAVYYKLDNFKNKLPINIENIPEVKHKGFKVETDSSYFNRYSNVKLLHDIYKEHTKDNRDPKLKDPHIYLQFRIYVEGIGTLRDKEDDVKGSVLGEGDRGVIARVEKACQDILLELEKQLIGYKTPFFIDTLKFDVFGFSRGAAAARHFCNEVLKQTNMVWNENYRYDKQPVSRLLRAENPDYEKYDYREFYTVKKSRQIFTGGYLGKLLKTKEIYYPWDNVTIEFLGLFDSVISQFLEKTGIIDTSRKISAISKVAFPYVPKFKKNIADKVALIKKVNPETSHPNIKKIFHIEAQNEWRENFPITPITKNKESGTIRVLGAHSDIGGCYWNVNYEINTLHFFEVERKDYYNNMSDISSFKVKLRNWYIDEKYCENYNLRWETMHYVDIYRVMYYEPLSNAPVFSSISFETVFRKREFMGDDTEKVIDNKLYKISGYHFKLISKRKLDNKLSLSYFNVMKHMAAKFGEVPLTISEDKVTKKEEYQYNKDYDLKDYEEHMIKIAEHGWKDKTGEIIYHDKLFYEEKGKKYYKVPEEFHTNILKNFVHLSAHFNASIPDLDIIKEYKIFYPCVPNMTFEKSYKDPPYERESYSPIIEKYDKE